MNSIMRSGIASACLLALVAVASPAAAQQAAPNQQVISANPFGLLLEVFNAEYERVITSSSTAGLGGSYIAEGGEEYLNADAFWRYYPQGRPLQGWAFGGKVGLTNVPESGTYLGYGFDLNHSWLLGAEDNFYVGVGFGLKRLIGAGDEGFGLEIIPTIRLVNIGIAF